MDQWQKKVTYFIEETKSGKWCLRLFMQNKIYKITALQNKISRYPDDVKETQIVLLLFVMHLEKPYLVYRYVFSIAMNRET